MLSDEAHYGEFICVICRMLVDLNDDRAVMTSCSHVYCRSCLEKWVKGNPSCPTCKADLSHTGTQITCLKTASPLAWRVLSRVRVRCPLAAKGANCKWTGEYADLHTHLQMRSEHIFDEKTGASASFQADESRTTALALKEEANERYKLGTKSGFMESIALYTKAIEVCNGKIPVLFSNRAAAHFMLKTKQGFLAAFADCETCLERLDSEKYDNDIDIRAKVYLRGAKALAEIGQFDGALKYIMNSKKYPQLENHKKINRQISLLVEIKTCFDETLSAISTKSSSARSIASKLLRYTSAPSVILLAARAELASGECERAMRLTLSVLRHDRNESLACLLRGVAFCLNGEFDDGVTLIKETLRLNPDDKEAKRLWRFWKAMKANITHARKYVSNGEYSSALKTFSCVLEPALETTQQNQARDNFSGKDVIDIADANEIEGKKRYANGEKKSPYHDIFFLDIDGKLPQKSKLSSTLLAERGNAYFRLGRHQEALKDCSMAIYAHDDCVRAWLTKSYCMHKLERHQEILSELSDLMQRWGGSDPQIRGAYERAEFLLRKSRRPDYYAIVSGSGKKLSSLSSEIEIKAAYKQRAMELHPDRLPPDASPKDRAAAEEAFKQLGEALEVLTTESKRTLYDEGYDKEAIEQRLERARRGGGHGHHHGHGHGHR